MSETEDTHEEGGEEMENEDQLGEEEEDEEV